MKLISRLLPLLTTAFLVLLLILLAWHCADIYFFTPDSSASIFTYTDVAARLKSLLPLVAVCTLLIILTLVAAKPRSKSGQPAKRNNFDHRGTYSKACIESRSLLFIRTTLLLIAVVFIVWGVFNGGLYDVFVKAINICTECIGLG